MHSIVVGTAGHIDHGKSALVQALTGKNPDRLPEEKRRGITIDLGFADLDLGDVRVGFVDVPGHERFVKNMLAGVHGIDAVALVIAADEGVMPQTREHFDICRLLEVRQGLVVLTKTDLVEEELLSLVRAEAAELVAGSFLETAPIIAVSARTGEGLEDFRAALRQIAKQVPARSTDFVARLPIDRAFIMKGFGTIVTGTLISGEITSGDELELLPTGRRVRTRGIQVHGNAVAKAQSGQRTALNLAGVDATEIERGMVLSTAGRLRPTQIVDVELNVLPNAPRSVRSRSRLRVHVGSAEVLARVRVLNTSGEIAPGQIAFAQLRFESPVITLHRDRFIVRSYSPSQTIGGGVILDPQAAKHRGREMAKTQEKLRALTEADRSTRLTVFVVAAGDHGLRFSDVASRTGWTDEVIAEVTKQIKDKTVIETEGVLIAKENFEELGRKALQAVTVHHQREPLSRGLLRETLRERHFSHAPPEVFRAVIARLEKDGRLQSEKDVVRVSGQGVALSATDVELREKIATAYERAGLEAPAFDQVLQSAGVPPTQRAHGRKILQLLLDNRTLIRVQGDMYFHSQALNNLKQRLTDYAKDHEPDRLIDVSTFKDLAGVSRKYAIPLLEYLDSERVTRRAGDKRIVLK